MKKISPLVLILFLLFITLRIFNLFTPLTTEEILYYSALFYDSFQYGFPHPPLAFWSFDVFGLVFGKHIWAYKLAPFFYSALTFWLIYFFCKRFFSYKTAIFSLLLLTVNFGQMQASDMLDTDGIILAFYSLLTLSAIYIFLEKRTFSSKVFLGFCFGLSLLTKTSAIILFGVIFLSIFLNINKLYRNNTQHKKFLKVMQDCCIVLIFAILTFSIFPIHDFIFNDGYNVYATILRVLSTSATQQGDNLLLFLFNKAYRLFQFVVYASPPLIILSILWFIRKRSLNPLSLFVLLEFLFFGILFSPLLDIARYLLAIIPILCIMAGEYLNKLKINKKNVFILSTFTFLFFCSFIISGLEHKQRFSFNEPEKIIQNIKNFNYDIYIPTWGAGGPKFLFLDLKVIIFSLIFAILLFFLILLKNEMSYFNVIILALLISYNLFFGLENSFYLTSPNIDKIKEDVVNYALKIDLREPIALSHSELGMDLFKKYNNTLPYNQEHLLQLKNRRHLTNNWLINKNNYLVDELIRVGTYRHFVKLDTNWKTNDKVNFIMRNVINPNGTIIYLDIPYGDKNGDLWELITKNCRLIKLFKDKNYDMAYIFGC